MFTLKLLLKRSCWTFIFMALALPVSARVCFLPDSTDCGEGDVDVPEVQITCATYGGYEAEAACLEARADKTAQICTLNSGCYYPKCAYDSERKCKNDNPDKKCLSQDVDGVKCWYSQPKTCSEQGYKNTPCATDEDSGTVPSTLEASDGPCYKCTPKKECKYISNLYYGPKDTCPQYTDRKDAGVTGKDGVCSTCEPQACTTINAAYKNAANQNTCGSDKVATKVTGTDSAADGPCYTCEDKPAGCTYEYTRIDDSNGHGDSTFSLSLYSDFQNRSQNTRGASYYWKGPGSFEQNYDYSGFQMYSKIDKNSKTCYDKKGTLRYETICPGTARVACKKDLVPNGCSSEQYVAGRMTIESMSFGDCVRVCDVSEGLYDTEDACMTDTKGYSAKCTKVDNCYEPEVDGFLIKIDSRQKRNWRCYGWTHSNSCDVSAYAYLRDIKYRSDIKDDDYPGDWAKTVKGQFGRSFDDSLQQFPAGTYYLCFGQSGSRQPNSSTCPMPDLGSLSLETHHTTDVPIRKGQQGLKTVSDAVCTKVKFVAGATYLVRYNFESTSVSCN